MKSEIPGVAIIKLDVHYDDRGSLWELLRNDDYQFVSFGQAYISSTLPGVVKGFHMHQRQYDNIAVVRGRIKLVLGQVTHGSPSIIGKDGHRGGFDLVEEIILIPGNYLVTIPPGIWHGWKNIGADEAFVVNTPSEHYDRAEPDELRADPHKYYDWSRKDK